MVTIRFLPLIALAAAPPALAAPRVPADAPDCAAPGTRPLFVAPMGEPFRAAPGERYPSAAWIARADLDQDGRIDRAEMVRDADRVFHMLDLDHDGRLSPEEIAAYERDVAPEIALYARPAADGGRATRSAGGGYGGAMGAGRFAWLNIPEPVAAADLDVDRIVTEREFALAAARRFDMLRGTADALAAAALGRTPQQAAIEGPCRPPRRRPDSRDRGRADQAHAAGVDPR